MTAGVAAPKRVSKGLTFRRWFTPSGAWSYELPGMCRNAAFKRDERLAKQWGGGAMQHQFIWNIPDITVHYRSSAMLPNDKLQL